MARHDVRIVVGDGTPVAALIPIADLPRRLRLGESDQEAREVLAAMRAPLDDAPVEEIARQTERIVAEICAKDRAERACQAIGVMAAVWSGNRDEDP